MFFRPKKVHESAIRNRLLRLSFLSHLPPPPAPASLCPTPPSRDVRPFDLRRGPLDHFARCTGATLKVPPPLLPSRELPSSVSEKRAQEKFDCCGNPEGEGEHGRFLVCSAHFVTFLATPAIDPRDHGSFPLGTGKAVQRRNLFFVLRQRDPLSWDHPTRRPGGGRFDPPLRSNGLPPPDHPARCLDPRNVAIGHNER